MKEWISDKKNQPIVIGIASAVILCTVVFLLFQFGVFGSNNNVAVAPTPGASMPGGPGGPPMPGGPPNGPPPPGGLGSAPPGAPGATASAQGAPAPAASTTKRVMMAKGGKADPFQPTYNAKALIPPPPRVSVDVPVQDLSHVLPPLNTGVTATAAPPLPAPPTNVQLGTISGIIFSNGVHAIYESNGTATVIQPGDQLPDGAGRVASIQGNTVTIDEGGGHDVTLPITAGSAGDNNGQNGNPPPAGV